MYVSRIPSGFDAMLFFLHETDFDECQAPDLNECHEKAKCINTLGSYNCTCLDGYVGNGILCQGMFFFLVFQ